jgi:hypothetical protein
LDYFPKSIKGNATFLAEIRDKKSSKILWNSRLNTPDGQSKIGTFFVPSDVSNIPVELRIYIITEDTGEHSLTIKNMRIT